MNDHEKENEYEEFLKIFEKSHSSGSDTHRKIRRQYTENSHCRSQKGLLVRCLPVPARPLDKTLHLCLNIRYKDDKGNTRQKWETFDTQTPEKRF